MAPRAIIGEAIVFALLLAAPAAGHELQGSGISEIRIGANFHDVYPGLLPTTPRYWSLKAVEDLTFDILLQSPDTAFFHWLGAPRPNIGGTFSTANRESILRLALTWQWQMLGSPVYLEGTLGAALHDGALTGATLPARNFGCRVNFYEAIGVGARMGDNVTATLFYEHTSNGEACSANMGLSNLGLKFGYRF